MQREACSAQEGHGRFVSGKFQLFNEFDLRCYCSGDASLARAGKFKSCDWDSKFACCESSLQSMPASFWIWIPNVILSLTRLNLLRKINSFHERRPPRRVDQKECQSQCALFLSFFSNRVNADLHALRCEAKLECPCRSTRSISPTLPTRKRLRLWRAAQLQEKKIYPHHPSPRPRESADPRNPCQLPTPTEALDPLPVGANGANRPQPIAQQQQISSHIPMKTPGLQNHASPAHASTLHRHSWINSSNKPTPFWRDAEDIKWGTELHALSNLVPSPLIDFCRNQSLIKAPNH